MRNSLQYCGRLMLNICRSLGNLPDASAGLLARKVNLFRKMALLVLLRDACPSVAALEA